MCLAGIADFLSVESRTRVDSLSAVTERTNLLETSFVTMMADLLLAPYNFPPAVEMP
jgi:hypothetical protein